MEPQAVWAVIAGVLILALGVFLFCRPETFWRLTEQWKSYRADEPPAFTASAPNSAVFVLWRRGLSLPFCLFSCGSTHSSIRPRQKLIL